MSRSTKNRLAGLTNTPCTHVQSFYPSQKIGKGRPGPFRRPEEDRQPAIAALAAQEQRPVEAKHRPVRTRYRNSRKCDGGPSQRSSMYLSIRFGKNTRDANCHDSKWKKRQVPPKKYSELVVLVKKNDGYKAS